jgi:2-alkyl-3-oxoalkanoate reductase
LLLSAGHSVLGLTRTPGKAETIRRAGADVAVVDALDGVAVRQAVISAKPDVIVHEMTALSGISDLRRFDRVFQEQRHGVAFIHLSQNQSANIDWH